MKSAEKYERAREKTMKDEISELTGQGNRTLIENITVTYFLHANFKDEKYNVYIFFSKNINEVKVKMITFMFLPLNYNVHEFTL